MSEYHQYTEADQEVIRALSTGMSEVMEERLRAHGAVQNVDNAILTCIAVDVCITIANSFASTHFQTSLPPGGFRYLRSEIQQEISNTYKKHLASLN